MKIILPSKGALGDRVVDMRPATFADLRNVQSLNQEEELLKIEFVQSLVKDLHLDRITKMDMDYLFIIAAMQVQLNSVGFTVTCKCGSQIKDLVKFGDQDLIELPKTKLPYHTTVGKSKASFTLLSAQNHLDACIYALQQEDFKSAYEDACAAFIFCKDLSCIEWVKQLDIATYLSAFLFQKSLFHGVVLKKKILCPDCGKVTEVQIKPTTDLIKIDTNVLMDQFVNVTTVLDFDNFLKMTIPEFNTFKETVKVSCL